jgi:hypothetical protein
VAVESEAQQYAENFEVPAACKRFELFIGTDDVAHINEYFGSLSFCSGQTMRVRPAHQNAPETNPVALASLLQSCLGWPWRPGPRWPPARARARVWAARAAPAAHQRPCSPRGQMGERSSKAGAGR